MTFRNALLFFIASLLCMVAYGQTYEGDAAKALIPIAKTVQINERTDIPSFIVFEDELQVSVKDFATWERASFQYEDGLTFKTRKTVVTESGLTHEFRDQYYHDVPIEHALSVIHHQNGKVVYVNGDIHNRIGISTIPNITESDAQRNALKHLGIDVNKWSALEDVHRHASEDEHHPHNHSKNSLIIYPYEGKYRLSWKLHLTTYQLGIHMHVYTDAQTGEVIHVQNATLSCDNGAAQTTYRGNQEILTDFNGTNFILRNDCGTADIRTTDAFGIDFTDANNFWFDADNFQRAARTAHFGVSGAFNYFEVARQQIGLTGAGNIDVRVFEGEGAFFNPNNQTLNFGLGESTGSEDDDVTAPDVCGHEFAHGVLFNTGGVTGTGHETLSLHEGIADIFGNEVEAFMDGAAPEWSIGEEVQNLGVRFLDRPNDDVHPGNDGSPDTYLGDYWTGNLQWNDGGVIRYWYYLLSEGGSGVNDNGQHYEVEGLGSELAAEILFDAIVAGNFGANPNYNTARNATIQAATAEHGECSPEVGQVIRAWHAVGIGPSLWPDLILADFQVTAPNTILAGGSLWVTYDVAANNDIFIQNTTVGFYLKTYCPGSNGLFSPFSTKIDPVDCGETTSTGATLSLPANITPGTYYLIAKVDNSSALQESNELNNSICLLIEVEEPPSQLPDFVIRTASVSPSIVDAGASFNISYGLSNQGTGYGGYSYTCYYLSTDATFSPNDIPIGSNFCLQLPPFSSTQTGGTASIPAGTSPGEYYIILQADCSDWYEELNENNNLAAVPITVTGLTGPLSDLTITNVHPSIGPPPLRSPGSWMGISYDLENLSTFADPGPTTTRIFLSEDETLSFDDIPLVSDGGQLPGTHAAAFQIPYNATTNQYYKILIVADYLNQETELLETNNVGIGHVVVYGSPLLAPPGGSPPVAEQAYDASTITALKVFPNPTHDRFTVAYTVQEAPIDVSIFNATGQELLRHSINEAAQTGQWQYDGEPLPAGLYYIQWQTQEGVELLKLVVE